MVSSSSSFIFPGVVFIFGGTLILLLNFYYHKKGKMLVFPWAKTLFGRRATWSFEYLNKNNIDEWSLFWHYLIYGYILSIIFITVGIIIILIDIGLVRMP